MKFQRVKFGKDQYDAIKKFEVQHHGDFWKLIMDKVSLRLLSAKKSFKWSEKEFTFSWFRTNDPPRIGQKQNQLSYPAIINLKAKAYMILAGCLQLPTVFFNDLCNSRPENPMASPSLMFPMKPVYLLSLWLKIIQRISKIFPENLELHIFSSD